MRKLRKLGHGKGRSPTTRRRYGDCNSSRGAFYLVDHSCCLSKSVRLTAIASMSRKRSCRAICLNVQPEESCDRDYDDNDADDVENVHCALRSGQEGLQDECMAF